jgi:hypothetical protein
MGIDLGRRTMLMFPQEAQDEIQRPHYVSIRPTP